MLSCIIFQYSLSASYTASKLNRKRVYKLKNKEKGKFPNVTYFFLMSWNQIHVRLLLFFLSPNSDRTRISKAKLEQIKADCIRVNLKKKNRGPTFFKFISICMKVSFIMDIETNQPALSFPGNFYSLEKIKSKRGKKLLFICGINIQADGL